MLLLPEQLQRSSLDQQPASQQIHCKENKPTFCHLEASCSLLWQLCLVAKMYVCTQNPLLLSPAINNYASGRDFEGAFPLTICSMCFAGASVFCKATCSNVLYSAKNILDEQGWWMGKQCKPQVSFFFFSIFLFLLLLFLRTSYSCSFLPA